MARFLLVHGASHGAWCWRDVLPALTALGHDALAIDLPSHGADKTPPDEVSLDSYVAAILERIDAPTILVGHSMAGVPIAQAAETAPERIARLVYLCAYRPGDGDSVGSLRKRQTEQPLLPAIRRDPNGVTFQFDPALAPAIFYQDCTPEAVAHALAHLTPEAIPPQATPVARKGAAAAVPESYIICQNDRAIPPEAQRDMAADLPPGNVHERPWSHSPFLSDPQGLAALLDEIAQS